MKIASNRQHGVALVTVLLVVAIATVLGVSMAKDQHRLVMQARNQFDLTQARQYALGGEELARQILHEDFIGEPGVDHLLDPWAAPDLFFEFDDGEVSLQIIDLQSRLNVNALAGDQPEVALERMRRLVAQLGLDASVVDRVRDWIDADLSAQPLGAEDYEYLGLEQPYRTPGQFMADLSELRLLYEMDPTTFELLQGYLASLPVNRVPVNINTAPAEVLASLGEGMSPEVIQPLIEFRDEGNPWETVERFLQEEAIPPGTPPAGLGVQSAFFEVRVRARYQDRFAYLTSVIQRDLTTGRMLVIYRNTGRKILLPVDGTQVEPTETDA